MMASEMNMPAIGLGTWQALDDAELTSALNAALECGYRHIDTAFIYQNEAIIGRVLKEWLSSGKLKREDLFITTKLPMNGIHEDRVDMFMEKSLKNLGLNYVDLYLIHFPVGVKYVEGSDYMAPNQIETEKTTDHIKIWKKMEEQVDAGRAKFIGLSNFNEKQIEKVWNNSRIKPACLQVELHLFLQQPSLVNYCQEKKITVVAYSPLASPAYNKFMAKLNQAERDLPNVFTNQTVQEIAKKHQTTNGQIALRYLIEKNIVPIPKSVTPSRLKENFEALNFRLDADDMKKLEKLNVGEPARIFDFKLIPQFREHPEWPLPK